MESKPEENVISIEEIKEKAKGRLVKIPDWDGAGEINVRVKSIDITPVMLESGIIPDELSVDVATMFEVDGKKDDSFKSQEQYKMKTKKMAPLLEAVAKEALVEPTFDDIQQIYPLTFKQKLAIFNHATGGIEKLKPFRK